MVFKNYFCKESFVTFETSPFYTLSLSSCIFLFTTTLLGLQLHPVAPGALPEEAVAGGDAGAGLQVQLLRAGPAEREGDRLDQDHDQLLGRPRPHLLEVLEDRGSRTCCEEPGAE